MKREYEGSNTRGLSEGTAGRYGVRTVNGAGAVRVEEGVGLATTHNIHLGKIRHWKWAERPGGNQELIRAPAHPLSGGLPVIHLLWQWSKSPKGYKLSEAMLEHPSLRYGPHMEGCELPESAGGGDAAARGEGDGSSGRNLPGLKAEQNVKLEPRVKHERDDHR